DAARPRRFHAIDIDPALWRKLGASCAKIPCALPDAAYAALVAVAYRHTRAPRVTFTYVVDLRSQFDLVHRGTGISLHSFFGFCNAVVPVTVEASAKDTARQLMRRCAV